MEKHEIFIDLSKCTQAQINWIMSVIPKGDFNYVVYKDCNCLIYWRRLEGWEIFTNVSDSRTEVTFDQFKELCAEWGYVDVLPKQLTELEKECLNFLENISSFHGIKVELESYCFNDNDTYLDKALELITKIKSHETI